MDQQTKNRRIHELLGKCWHDLTTERTDTGFVSHCSKCLTRWNEFAIVEIMPNYYNDITTAREALAFAVEQKGAEVVGHYLSKVVTDKWEDGVFVNDLWFNDLTAAALAPPSVLCETVLSVFGVDKEK